MRAYEEILGFNIPVYKLLGMHKLESGDDLYSYGDDSSESELAIAPLKEVFEGGSQEIHDHDVVVLVFAEVEESGDADVEGVGMVVEVGEEFGFVLELLMFGLDGFQLDCHDLSGLFVDGVVDFSKRTGCHFLGELVMLANY